jgi:class 3 adenylate cyclase
VNVAARVQELTKAYDVPILASAETRAAAGDGFGFRAVATTEVAGRTQPVALYAAG